jgi:hypothetical protein
MTSLRFVGDLSIWPGLFLALLVAVMSWRFYNRESFDLPPRLRIILPLLRSSAFFLGIMVLTGPVLHHRTTIGEPGKVRIYLDASQSMTMLDPQMSIGRKLLAAQELNWLKAGTVDTSLLTIANGVAAARAEIAATVTRDGPANTTFDVAEMQRFLDQFRVVETQLSGSLKQRFAEEVLTPLETLSQQEPDDSPLAQLSAVIGSMESIESEIRVAFDQSLSSISDSGDNPVHAAVQLFDSAPRWQRLQQHLLASNSDVLASLRSAHDVQLFALASPDVIPLTDILIAAQSVVDQSRQAEQPMLSAVTDLSSGILSTQSTFSTTQNVNVGNQSAHTAIVLMTDGQHNDGPSPLQTARILGNQGVRFFPVAFGAATHAPDLAVVDVKYPELVFQTDRIRGTMTVRDRMPPGRPFVAQIRFADTVVWQQQLITQDIASRIVDFEFSIDALVDEQRAQFTADLKQHVVPMTLEASIAPLPEESETANNTKMIRLAAITQSYRVLILDGRSRWETRYLRNLFERDKQWHVDTVIAGPGTDNATLPRGDQANQFPADQDQLFEYDLVIFGELSGDMLADHEYRWLMEFVEFRGGGLIFIDGQRRMLRQITDPGMTALLPIKWIPDAPSGRPTSLQLTDRGASLGALTFDPDDQQNRRFWTELPPPRSLVVVEALPGVEVLVEARVGDESRPFMVTRSFGAGRILYLASDESWRWRYKAADTYHQRIWNQLAEFAMPRPFAVSDEFVSLDTGPVSYDTGDEVDIRIRLLGLDGRPQSRSTVDAVIHRDGRVVSTVTLDVDSAVPGIYRGRTGELPEGDYEVSVRASGYQQSVLKARTRFVVLPPESGEMEHTDANETLLRQLATASGGVFLREEQIGQLPELLSPMSHGRIVESDSLIWQSYWWFATIVILLTLEWILRKRAGLL